MTFTRTCGGKSERGAGRKKTGREGEKEEETMERERG